MLLQGFLRNKVIFLQISIIWSCHVHPSVPCNLILVCLHLCVNSGVSRSWVTCMALRQMCMLCSSIGMPLAWKLWVRSALVGPTLKLSSWMMIWRWTKWWAWGSQPCKLLFTTSVSDCGRTVYKSSFYIGMWWHVGFMVAFAKVSSSR